MLRFVLRDGFDAVELSIKENARADEQFAGRTTIAHTDVMREQLSIVEQISCGRVRLKPPCA
jgi:hypothetical protein